MAHIEQYLFLTPMNRSPLVIATNITPTLEFVFVSSCDHTVTVVERELMNAWKEETDQFVFYVSF